MYFCVLTTKILHDMNEAIRLLEPSSLWSHFADLNAVPRASKKEEQVIAFAKSFGENLGLQTSQMSAKEK